MDLAAEQRLAEFVAAVPVTGAHDLSDGGLAQALVEACLVGGRGARVGLPATLDPFVALFAESAARMLVTVAPDDLGPVLVQAAEAGVPAAVMGTTGGAALEIETLAPLTLDELHTAWTATLPSLFGP